MQKIVSEGMYYYTVNPSVPETFRIVLKLKDTVDGILLQNAADCALKRYPYYAVCCQKNEKEYYYEPNKKTFRVLNTKEPVKLGGKASNGYLMALSYYDDTIYLNVFHGMTDATGAMRFLRTLTYYYCCARYDANLSAEGIWINNNEKIPEEEFENPYLSILKGERILPKPDMTINPPKTEKAWNLLQDSRIHRSSQISYRVKISEPNLMKYCRDQDGTPAVVLSLLLSHAINKLNPKITQPIVTGMAVNLRSALDAPKYFGSPLGMTFLSYNESIRKLPFIAQATAYRGILFLSSDRDHLLAELNNSCKLYKMLDELPTIEMKRQLACKVRDGLLGKATFVVSYMGPSHMGAVEPYIKELELENDAYNNGIVLELMTANGYFFLNFIQEWQENLYFQAFCKELEEYNISYEVLDKLPNTLPQMDEI